MKVRNQFIALACLLAFAGLGFLYVRMWVVQKPSQIILFVSDALASRPLTAARLYAGGADYRFALEGFPNTALLRNSAEDFAVPDDSSAATALATGKRSSHRLVSATGTGNPLPTILEKAHESGRAIGLITNSRLSAPAVAAFYAHTPRSHDAEGIALQLFERDWIRLILGGGGGDFLPENAEGDWPGRRKDGRNLIAEWAAQGVEVVRSKAELEQAGAWEKGRVVGLFGSGPLAYANQLESGSQQPSVADMTRCAIELLRSDRLRGGRGSYLLVVDASLYSNACELNQAERALREVQALDESIAAARESAGDKALIMAVGRLSTGGLTLSGYPLRQQKGPEFLGLDPAGYPYLTWASGPNGPQPGAPAQRNEPAAIVQPSGLNTAEDMIGVGIGPGSERLRGFLDNTAIFDILNDAL